MSFEIPRIKYAAGRPDDFVQKSLEKLRRHDKKTYEHSMEVGNMAAFVIAELGVAFSKKEKKILLNAAFLHDYGKIGVDACLLNKESDLSLEEIKKIQHHPQIGFEALKNWDIDVAKVVVAHHEYQKHAYPREKDKSDVSEKKLGDIQTHKLSRILAIIDSFQAMLANRPGKNNKSKAIDDANSELQKKFRLPGDQEIIFLLETYYRQKNEDAEVDDSKYIGIVGNA